MFLVILIFYLHLVAAVILGYTIKNLVLRWICELYPIFWLVFLFRIRFDIFSCSLVWLPAFAGVVILWILFFIDIIKRTELRNSFYILSRLVRPCIASIIFVLAVLAHGYSQKMADAYAIEKAREIQKIIDTTGKCPLEIADWTNDEGASVIMYGKIGPKFPIIYTATLDAFRIQVRHHLDDRLYIDGGVDQKIHAFGVIDSEYTDIIGKALVEE